MWQVIGASVKGTSHIKLGTNCQDWHGYKPIKNRGVIAAVADGLGSAKKSDDGARVSVESAIDTLAQSLDKTIPLNSDEWKDLIFQSFANARLNLERKATDDGFSVRDYGATLIVGVIVDNWLVIGHIGDGAVVALFDDDSLDVISLPQRGEFANETTPITAPNALNQVRFFSSQKATKAIALLSDGLQSISIEYSTNTPFQRFFKPFFDVITQTVDVAQMSNALTSFLDSERVCAKTDDDKTLVLIGKVLDKQEVFNQEHPKREVEQWELTPHSDNNLSQPLPSWPEVGKVLYLKSLDSLIKLLKYIIQIIEQ